VSLADHSCFVRVSIDIHEFWPAQLQSSVPHSRNVYSKMAVVPDNQKIEKLLKVRYNKQFADIADELLPQLQEWDRLPRRLVEFEKDSSKYFGLRAVETSPVEELPSMLWGKGDQFVLDFGIHMVAHLSFHLEGEGTNVDAPCRMRVTFGESPFDVTEDQMSVNTWISTSWLPDETITIDFMPENVSLPRRHSFRYIRFQIIDTSPKYEVKFSNIVCKAVSCVGPENRIDVYSFEDPLLRSLDQLSVFTLRDCMQTVFEDGPRRDRRLWIGDLRLQALTNYCTFRDYNLVKRCLFMFAALSREDSSLPACLFEKPNLRAATDYIVDYDALFGPIVYDYVVASGDVKTGHALWPTIQGSLKMALSHIDPATGAFDPSRTKAWKFLDWEERLDHTAGMHGLLLYSLKSTAALAKLLNIPSLPYNEEIEKMTNAAGVFLDKQSGSFVSGEQRQVSHASAAWLTLSGAFPIDVCRKGLQSALELPESVKPLTPYLYHHVCDALASVELYEECLKRGGILPGFVE
jgi:alpha-L-rhamnosidase